MSHKSFTEAIQLTEGKERNLLIGNGFSASFFQYENLFDAAKIEENPSMNSLFLKLDTKDFEVVLSNLVAAKNIINIYREDNNINANDVICKLESDEQFIRKSLVEAIRITHPPHRDEIVPIMGGAVDFLSNFSKFFTLNYDLLLYWIQLEESNMFGDGFGLGTNTADGMRGPFSIDSRCNTFFLHGGLHLFQREQGLFKQLRNENGVINAIAHSIEENKLFPLYVAEGTSIEKMREINNNEYLLHCYQELEKLEKNTEIFIFGHSCGEKDEHIYKAVFSSNVSRVWFGIYNLEREAEDDIRDKLSRFSRKGGKNTPFEFYDSATVNLWG